MSVSNIVNVSISRQTTQVSRAGFGVALILGPNAPFGGRVKEYTDPADMLTDGYDSADPEYIAATKLMSQSNKPEKFKTGKVDVGDADLAATMTAVRDEDDDWYALIYVEHADADVEEAAVIIETLKKIYLSSSSTAGILDGTDDTDIGFTLKDAAYDRTGLIYHTDPATFPEAALLGRQLPLDPGSSTWKFKTLTGIASTSLSSAEKTAALASNVNTYTTVGGVNITEEGVMASGEYIDVIRGIDWLESRIKENVFAELVNQEKIPFTDGGIAAIEALIKEMLELGVGNGVLSNNPAPFTTVPLVANVLAADKAARTLTGVKFEGVLAGAIHKTTIAGVVTV